MFSLLRKRQGQSTAEYAIVIGIIVAAAVAMQTYVKRSMQGGVKFAVDKLSNSTQYEPYYLQSDYTTTTGGHTDSERTSIGGGVGRTFGTKQVTRTGTQTVKNITDAD